MRLALLLDFFHYWPLHMCLKIKFICCNSSQTATGTSVIYFWLKPTYTDYIIGCFAFCGCVRLFSISSWHPQLAFFPQVYFYFIFLMLNMCEAHSSQLNTLFWLQWKCLTKQYDLWLLWLTPLNWLVPQFNAVVNKVPSVTCVV